MKTTRRLEYETTDGRTFRDRAVARKHQAYLDLVAFIRARGGNHVEDANMVAEDLIDGRAEVLRLLRNAEEAKP